MSRMRAAGRVVVASAACWLLAAGGTWAQAPSLHAPEPLRRLAIQHNGRHKPFDSFAREAVRFITGRDRWDGQDPLDTAWAIIAEPERWQAAALISVPFVPLREALGMPRTAAHISYDELIATRRLMRLLPAIVEKQRRDEHLSLLDHEALDAYQRFVLFNSLIEQRLELVPPPGTAANWLPVLEPAGHPEAAQQQIRSAWSALIEAQRSGDTGTAEASARGLASTLRSLRPDAYPAAWRLDLEVFSHRAAPFQAAKCLYLLAAGVLIMAAVRSASRGMSSPRSRPPRWRAAGWGLVAAGWLVHAAGILTRMIIGGRPPVSNFFETMLWLPFVAVGVALVLGRVYRAAYIGAAASLLAALTLWIAEFVPLDASVTPVVAVLRSNLWLTVHVLTIVASYGAIALATALAHIYGWLYLLPGPRHAALKELSIWLYRALQIGVVLLAGGIMLGAVWANASWGRYWGWDPKETWALITLLWYLALLHGRFAGWIRGVGLALGTIGGFFLLLMTYYGVSFYLVGLHSYAGGHAKPLPAALVGYVLLETCFLATVGTRALRRRAT